jgi:hypothetical protein
MTGQKVFMFNLSFIQQNTLTDFMHYQCFNYQADCLILGKNIIQ